MTGSVVQPWVARLPWKMQSILFSGLRGPDVAQLAAVKEVTKWMRSVAQENADPSKPYMNEIVLPAPAAVSEQLEYCTCHYVHHLADALRVIAYGHPGPRTSTYAFALHLNIAEELFHFIPELDEVFEWRHRDKPDGIDHQPIKPLEDRDWTHLRAGRMAADGHP